MPHVRKQIRDAAVTALTGLGATGSRVFDSRATPLSEGDLPCLVVYTEDEEVELDSLSGGLSRSMALAVQGFAQATSGVEDTLDLIAEQVETALGAGLALADWVVPATIQTEITDEGDQPVGVITITFSVQYRTTLGAPTAGA